MPAAAGGGWGYNQALSSTSTGTEWLARREHEKKGGEAAEQKEQRATKERGHKQARSTCWLVVFRF